MVQKIHYAKAQMNNGLVSSILEGRAADFAAMDKSCRQVLNCVPTVYGSMYNRGGSIYVNPVNDSTVRTTLIPFIVGERVAYVLEFGDRYVRVYRYHNRVLTDSGAPYEITSPFKASDMFNAEGRCLIDFKQSADVMYMVHENYPSTKLIRFGETNWQFANIAFEGGPWLKQNQDPNKKIKASADNGIITLTSSTGSNPVGTHASVATNGNTYSYGNRIKIYQGGYNGAGTAIAERYGAGYPGNGNQSWAEWAAEIFNSFPQFLALNPTRGSIQVTAINNQATYSGLQMNIFCETVIPPVGTGATSWKYNNFQFTQTIVSADVFTPDWVGKKIRLHQTDTVVPGWRAGLAVSTGTIVRTGMNFYSAASAGTTGGQMPTHTEGTESDGSVAWEYLHSGYGWGEIVEYISPTEVRMKVLGIIPAGIVGTGTDQWELSLFGYEENPGTYPCAVDFYKDRLVLGINTATGPKVLFSVAGDYENFSDMDHGEQLPESSMDLLIFSNLNKINWLSTLRDLYVGTEGAILSVHPITTSEVFGPDNITYDELASVGSCKVKPIKVGGDLLYLGPKGTEIYSIQYNFAEDSYEPIEISILASEHLEQGITGWAFQQVPTRVIWAVRTDGKVVGLTYNKQHEVRAFQLYETAGKVESVCSIPNINDNMDEVWTITQRTIQGVPLRYIEYFKLGLPESVPLEDRVPTKRYLQYLLDNCVYLDCAKTFLFSVPTTQLTGLSHLEGLEVVVVADNKDKKYTVIDGQITLSKGAKNVKVGLPYISILEPQPVNQDVENGTGQARSQRINKIFARISKTHSFKYGEDMSNLAVAKVNTDYDNIDEVLMSGDLSLDWPGNNTTQKIANDTIVNATGARMIFVQDRPFPVHWSAFIIQIGVSDD